jgi:lactate oxidase
MGQSRRSSAPRSRAVVASARGVARGKRSPGSPAAAVASAARVGGPDKALSIVNFDLLEAEAKRVLSAGAYAFIAGGAGDQWTLRENRRAFNDFPILPRRLAGLAAPDIDLRIRLLEHELPYPILVAPMGACEIAHPEAEVAAAGGTGAAQALYTASGPSNKPLEAIAKATTGPKWFQLYFNADVGVTRSLLRRAYAAGYSAIVFTVDSIGPGQSDEFIRLGRPFPRGMTYGNHDPRYGGTGNLLNKKVAVSWDDIGLVREVSGLPVIVKGILRPQDALAAVTAGAAAIQVSNHGGRQQDGVPASITVLREVVDALAGRVPVILDGGIRRGIDVFRALALGAQAVAVGRPVLYGLAVGGASGVRSVLEHLRDELRSAMLLAGAHRVTEISLDFLRM